MQCEWYTPKPIIDKAREVLGTIDTASNDIAQQIVEAKTFYTKEDDGLKFPWKGNVWCNPAALLKRFTKKFVEECAVGHMTEGIILTNSGTDTLWNQPLIKGVQAYTLGRISFLMPDGSERFQRFLLYLFWR